MKRTHRYSRLSLLLALVMPIVASACIVVVEEDQDRHRHLHGSEWYLEVVFYRTQTIQATDHSVQIEFDEDGSLTGRASCGTFNGTYSVNENGGFDVESVDLSENCGGVTAAQLTIDGLLAAQSYEADENNLRIATEQNGYLSFSTD